MQWTTGAIYNLCFLISLSKFSEAFPQVCTIICKLHVTCEKALKGCLFFSLHHNLYKMVEM